MTINNCPHCNGKAELIQNAFVRCEKCGFQGPRSVDYDTTFSGKSDYLDGLEAIKLWNNTTVFAKKI
jgi:predicted amidophosphoribosyltransferase